MLLFRCFLCVCVCARVMICSKTKDDFLFVFLCCGFYGLSSRSGNLLTLHGQALNSMRLTSSKSVNDNCRKGKNYQRKYSMINLYENYVAEWELPTRRLGDTCCRLRYGVRLIFYFRKGGLPRILRFGFRQCFSPGGPGSIGVGMWQGRGNLSKIDISFSRFSGYPCHRD